MPLYSTEVGTETLEQQKIADQPETESQVIVHCTVPPFSCSMVRIWKSTFLIDRHSDHKSRLLHAEGISLFPQWTIIDPRKPFRFILIFEALPKSCIIFDLKEIIPQSSAFYVPGILRNSTDVYDVTI